MSHCNYRDFCPCHCHNPLIWSNTSRLALCYCSCATNDCFEEPPKEILNDYKNDKEKKESVKKENIFDFIKVSLKDMDNMNHAKNALYDFYCWIIDNVKDNRERSLAITKLEESAMWLNKSISRSEKDEK